MIAFQGAVPTLIGVSQNSNGKCQIDLGNDAVASFEGEYFFTPKDVTNNITILVRMIRNCFNYLILLIC